jgi:hypothetical protein
MEEIKRKSSLLRGKEKIKVGIDSQTYLSAKYWLLMIVKTFEDFNRYIFLLVEFQVLFSIISMILNGFLKHKSQSSNDSPITV